MTLRSETPPPPGRLRADPPPDPEVPDPEAGDAPQTSAQLKGDIDSGRTADKAPHVDVGAAPLGTCDEAGGTPPTPQRVRLARLTERAPSEAVAAADIHGRSPWVVPTYIAIAVAIAVGLGLALWLTG